MRELTSHAAELRRLTRTDGDPRVRHRADALLQLAQGRSGEDAAHAMGCCTSGVGVWRRRFLAEGRPGLADRPRSGRPALLDGGRGAIGDGSGGLAAGLWLPRDDLDGGRSRRPAHATRLASQSGDRRARLAATGVSLSPPAARSTPPRRGGRGLHSACANPELQKRGHLPGLDFGLFTWMNVTCPPTPTWQRPGSGGDTRWV